MRRRRFDAAGVDDDGFRFGASVAVDAFLSLVEGLDDRGLITAVEGESTEVAGGFDVVAVLVAGG